jgi:hypothetical protein
METSTAKDIRALPGAVTAIAGAGGSRTGLHEPPANLDRRQAGRAVAIRYDHC